MTRLSSRMLSLLAVAALAVVAVALSLGLGTEALSLGSLWRAVTDPDGSDAAGIVREMRFPRTVLGLLVGLALGAAGALIQGHTRNPLADPGLLGVSAGASFAVVLGIVSGLSTVNAYVWLALLGSLVASVVVFGVASGQRGGPTPVTLTLAGFALSALLSSFSAALVLDDRATLNAFRFWVVGSLSGRDTTVARQVLPFILIGLVLAFLNTPALNAIGLGEDVARSLGQNLLVARAVGVTSVMLLVGGATAACGPIGFLGLVAPHLARALTGPDHRWLVPVSALLGVVVLLLADIAARIVVAPGELQTGIVLAVLGAPAFIVLIRRRRLVKV